MCRREGGEPARAIAVWPLVWYMPLKGMSLFLTVMTGWEDLARRPHKTGGVREINVSLALLLHPAGCCVIPPNPPPVPSSPITPPTGRRRDHRDMSVNRCGWRE